MFMIHTGFYDVALRKAAERRQARLEEDERRRKRMEELNVRIRDR